MCAIAQAAGWVDLCLVECRFECFLVDFFAVDLDASLDIEPLSDFIELPLFIEPLAIGAEDDIDGAVDVDDDGAEAWAEAPSAKADMMAAAIRFFMVVSCREVV